VTALVLGLLAGGTLLAGELKPETRQAWEEYAKSAEQRPRHSRVGARVHGAEIIVEPAAEPNPQRVPNGLIHDWAGAAFLPNAHVEDVVSMVRDYARYAEIYKPGVLAASLTSREGLHDRFLVTFSQGSYSKKTAVECTYEATYSRVDATHWYSVSRTVQVQQIDDYGGPHQHKLPMDQGNGYLWRLNRITWYEERDGGVFLDVEAIALSRDVPAALRWIITPIVRRIARETLIEWLSRMRTAVRERKGDVGPG
jgi:hypothetical protein